MDLNVEGTRTGRVSASCMNDSNIPQGAEVRKTITFLNQTGDITIAWDEHNREKILELVKKKMAEGYSFFTTKRYLFGTIERVGKISDRDLRRGKLTDLIITDEQFEKMVKDMADRDVAELLSSDHASLAKRRGKSDLAAVKRAKDAEEVLKSDALAVRPIRGG